MNVLLSIWEQQWFVSIIIAIVTALGGLIITGITYLTQLIKDKTPERLHALFEDLENYAAIAVMTVQQTYVDELKNTEGAWNEESQKQALAMAVDITKSYMSDQAKKLAKKHIADLTQYIVNLIEGRIAKNKLEGGK